MFVLPTYGRPDRLRETLRSIRDSGSPPPGIVVIDGDPSYPEDLGVPPGWQVLRLTQNKGVCGVLNEILRRFPHEPWYGFISDDSIVRTPDFAEPLIAAAGRTGFANSDDGWQSQRRMHGAVVFGGDLLRAMGWWAPPGLVHSFVDDAWEHIGRTIGNWKYCPQVVVEHRHRRNRKADNDPTYDKAYRTFEQDRETFRQLQRAEIPNAIARVISLVIDDPEKSRIARARSRSVMICTPVARHPAWQYTLALTETVALFERLGIRYITRFSIGSSNLPRSRNILAAQFLASECSDMIFIDDDMGWKANSVVRLLASDKPLIAGVGRKRVDKPNNDPAVWCASFSDDAKDSLRSDEMGNLTDPALKVGTGFMKISRTVFEQVMKAHPEWKRDGFADMEPEAKAFYHRFFKFGDDEGGEDFGFCEAWRELGGEIWIDPSIWLEHVGEKAYAGAIMELMAPQGGEEMKEAAE